MHRIIGLMILFILELTAFSQVDSSKVQIQFPNQGNFEIRIDENQVYTTTVFYLPNGTHTVEIWNAGMELIQDTILVLEGYMNRFRYGAKVDKNYTAYKKELNDYKNKKGEKVIFPLLLSGGFVTSAVILYRRGVKQYNNLLQLKELYKTSSDPVAVSSFKSNFKSANSRYNLTRSFFYGFVAASCLTGAIGLKGFLQFKKNFKRPVNNFFKSPFTNNDYSLSLQVAPNSATLTLNF